MIPVSMAPGFYRLATKTTTFTGASGLGLHGTSTTIFTVAGGMVVVRMIAGRATTSLTGASGTVKLGTTNSVSLFIGATTSTTLTTSAELWASTTATRGGIALAAADKEVIIDENVLIGQDVTNDTTGGVMEINCLWYPLTPGATLV